MKIERVQLTNFRQYFEIHRITFSLDPDCNVTVIHGVNGAGKTSFFTALNWCLYGESVDNIGQIISKEAVSRAKSGEIVETKVAITFYHDGERFTASRQLRGQKHTDGTIEEARGDTEFMLMRIPRGGVAESVKNPIGVMNTILPSNVRTYFLFDGEKIDNFARPEAAHEVRDAIYQVLSLEVLTRARDHLKNAARELRGQLKGVVSDELKVLIEQDTNLRADEDRLEKRIEQLKEEIVSAERHISEVNQQLRTFEEVQNLQRQHDLLTQQLKERQKERETLIEGIRDIASQSYISMSEKPITMALALLDEKRQRGEIPSNIREQFIKDLLERGICICGRRFDEHDNAHEHLENLMKTSVPTSLEDNVLSTAGYLRSLQERGNENRQRLNQRMKDKADLDRKIEGLAAQIDDLERQMEGSEHVEVSNLAKQRDEYRADIDGYQEEKIRAEMELEGIKQDIKDLEKKISQAEKTQYRERLLSKKLELAQDASDAINQVYEKFAEQKRKEVEEQTRLIFHELAWKADHFQDVRLTDDYQLEVIDRYGMPARPELSAGERQVLSLSFITAMAKVAQNEAPLIMDTPFGRLSSAHREAITNNLPALAPQLVLFVTDEELRDQSLDNLRPRIGAEYRLIFDHKTSCTEIKEVK
ncbi:MAG: AAA family ATPase [Chloroflexota bacterium]